MKWVQTYHDGTPPDYADSAEGCLRLAAAHPASTWSERWTLAPVADAEVDPDLAAELARWSTGDALALSVAALTARLPDLTDVEVLAAYHGETRGKGRSGALDAIAAEIRRRGL